MLFLKMRYYTVYVGNKCVSKKKWRQNDAYWKTGSVNRNIGFWNIFVSLLLSPFIVNRRTLHSHRILSQQKTTLAQQMHRNRRQPSWTDWTRFLQTDAETDASSAGEKLQMKLIALKWMRERSLALERCVPRLDPVMLSQQHKFSSGVNSVCTLSPIDAGIWSVPAGCARLTFKHEKWGNHHWKFTSSTDTKTPKLKDRMACLK